jgi:multiple sugar transport system ATP-binding protein
LAQVIIENLYKTYQSSPAVKSVSETEAKHIQETTEVAPNSHVDPQLLSNSILKRINLKIEDGEFMVLVGPSGCGKSTLLRLIAGLEDITAGKIYIGEQIVNNLPPKARDIAMVFQNYALYPHLSVYDNIAFGLRRMDQNRQFSSRELKDSILSKITAFLPQKWRYVSQREEKIKTRVNEVAQMLQIAHLLSRLPKELSGGQKQRVALGRAIARNPQAFLMDEPLSNLDAKLRTETRMQIVQLQKQLKTTTIYVTHDQTEAMTMGDRIAVMYEGKIQQLATPLEVYYQPANKFVAQFIGSPPMNMLEVNYQKPDIIKHPNFELKLSEKWQKILNDYNYDKIWLGIRPEHFELTESSSNSLAVVVDLVEALGNESIVTVNLVDNPAVILQVKIFGNQLIKRGEKINLAIKLDEVSFFDYYQEQNILSSYPLDLIEV